MTFLGFKIRAMGWSRCRDANPVPINLLGDDLDTAPIFRK